MNAIVDSLTCDLVLLRERYQKLFDSHGQLQMQNSLLEERILSIADIFVDEKAQLENELINAKQEINNFKNIINQLEIEKQRYKDDCNLAVTLLQQNPHKFISKMPDDVQKELKAKSKSTLSSHCLALPTFPPTFSSTFPLINTINSSLYDKNQCTATIAAINNLHLAAKLFKSDIIDNHSCTDYICSKCHQQVNYCDIGVQTSSDDQNSIDRIDSVSNLAFHLEHDNDWSPTESYYRHMKVQKYHIGNNKKLHRDIGLSSNAIPQMHHV